LHLRRTPSGVSLSRMCSTFRSHTLDSRVWTVHDHFRFCPGAGFGNLNFPPHGPLLVPSNLMDIHHGPITVPKSSSLPASFGK
jgi:hypothetical protein